MIKLALVDDHPFALQALLEKLSLYPDVEVVHQALNGADLMEQLGVNAGIDLVLMDINMPVMDGITATAVVKEKYPRIRIVITSLHDDDDYVFNAIRAGADSYLLKESPGAKLYEAITDTLAGGSVMSPGIAAKALRLLKNASPKAAPFPGISLSEREQQILEELSAGSTNKKIAAGLFISPFTVKRHIENIYKKLNAQNRVELLEQARQKGLL